MKTCVCGDWRHDFFFALAKYGETFNFLVPSDFGALICSPRRTDTPVISL
jgi:hypothetical protein